MRFSFPDQLTVPVTLNAGDQADWMVVAETALVTVNLSSTLSWLGAHMEPMKVPMPCVRLKLLSADRHVSGGFTSTVTSCNRTLE